MALAIRDRERLRKILDLSDRLGRLRRRVRKNPSAYTRRDLTQKIGEIASRVAAIGLPGALGDLAGGHHLGPQEVMVLLLLLNQRVTGGGRHLTGREILSTIFPSSFGMLTGAARLRPDAPLVRSGALEIVGADPRDVLETRYRVSDELFDAILSDVTVSPPGWREVPPYRNHWEHLADLGVLSALLLRRANALFDVDPYGNRAYAESEPVPVLQRMIDVLGDRIRERLAVTPEAGRFPMVRLSRRLHLGPDEQIILAALLVQECFYGNPGLEAVECVKMVSVSAEDLLRKRPLLLPGSRLRREGLIEIEDAVDDRELTAEVCLPRWLASHLLGEGEREPIGPDARIAFHEYLQNLEDSERFFRDLDA